MNLEPGMTVLLPRRAGRQTKVQLLEPDPKKAATRPGGRLGSWTSNFYKPRWLVRVIHADGKTGLAWVNESRILAGKTLNQEEVTA